MIFAKARLADPDPIMNAVTEWVASHTFPELKEKCDKAGVPISSVYSMKDIFEDPQYAARNDIVEVPCEEFGSIKCREYSPVLSETLDRLNGQDRRLVRKMRIFIRVYLG